jgi:hypothetical protein
MEHFRCLLHIYFPLTMLQTTYLPTHPPTNLNVLPIYLPRCITYLSTHPPAYLGVLPTYLPIHPPHTYILPTYLPTYPPVHLPIYILPTYLPNHPPTQLPCPTTYLLSWLTSYNQPKFMYLQPTYLINFLCYLPSYLLNSCMLPTYP